MGAPTKAATNTNDDVDEQVDGKDPKDLKPTVTDTQMCGPDDIVEEPDLDQMKAGVKVPTSAPESDDDCEGRMRGKRVGVGRRESKSES